MNQQIGNVGLLNLMNATEDSIKGIERIENIGMVIYRKENAHLLSALSIGNIGKSMEVPEGYSLYNGILYIDESYLCSINKSTQLLVNGMVIIDKNVKTEQLNQEWLQLMVNGKVYSPTFLAGAVSQLLSKASLVIETYEEEPPRIENGEFTMTNSFLLSMDNPLHLIVNGKLQLAQDLDMNLFDEKINKLEINGLASIYEEQEAYLYKKTSSLTSSVVRVIPTGFEQVKKQLRLNAKSIRRFKKVKLFTKKPIVIESDVTREALTQAIEKIDSTSIIICHEEVEDLVFECCVQLETEVLSYEHKFVYIEGEEEWSNDQFLALDQPANFIVNGQLTLDLDVTEDVLREKMLTLDIFGEVIVPEKKYKGYLQNVIRLNTGTVKEKGKMEKSHFLDNVGELSL
ncbi:hypothetical protein BTR23_09420 [Alkalihalophilus pseudofirmus]|nr:hypothetical protein BTR23_09420 [Alkalihalophilus pseudofirmus]